MDGEREGEVISPIAKTKTKVREKFTVLPYSNNALVTNLLKKMEN